MSLSEREISRFLDTVGPTDAGGSQFTIVRKTLEALNKRPDAPTAPATAPNLDVIFDQLKNLSLPEPILAQARPFFLNAHYEIAEGKAEALHDPRMERPFTQAVRHDGIKLALVRVPSEIYNDRRSWGLLVEAIEKIDAFVRLISEGHSETYAGFTSDVLEVAAARGKKWNFTPWNWIDNFLQGQENVEATFQLPRPGAESPSAFTLDDLTQKDRTAIINLLTDKAAAPGNLRPVQILQGFVDKAGWPKKLSQKVPGSPDDPEQAASFVVAKAIDWGNFEPRDERYGDTYLGALLQAVLTDVGLDDRKAIAGLIRRFNLVSRPVALQEIKKLIDG